MSLNFLKKYQVNLFDSAVELNHQNIMSLLEIDPLAKLLDLGCDDGGITLKMANKIGTRSIYGAEIMDARIKTAKSRGIQVEKFDLNTKFKFEDNFFDVVHGNQIIEHLYDTDNFVSEIFRVLKPGGYSVISTENASSWVNIISSVFGYQIFSLTNFSMKQWAIGNPLSVHTYTSTPTAANRHVRIYNYFGLVDYLKTYGFDVDKVMGAGYYPLPAKLGNIDKIHSHFLAVKARKPK